ncbi:hypothetical protein BaRGS_00006888, partial [Batillaria attramentaria]
RRNSTTRTRSAIFIAHRTRRVLGPVVFLSYPYQRMTEGSFVNHGATTLFEEKNARDFVGVGCFVLCSNHDYGKGAGDSRLRQLGATDSAKITETRPYSSVLVPTAHPTLARFPAVPTKRRTTTRATPTTVVKTTKVASTLATELAHHFTVYGQICDPLPTTVPSNASIFQCDFRTRKPVPCSHRLRAELACNDSSAEIVYRWVKLDSPPAVYGYNDTCLARVVAQRCTKGGLIPRVVHYVNFNRRKMLFHGLLSVLSAVRFIRPCLVLFHADYLPFGSFWDTLVQLVPHVIHVNRTQPTAIFDQFGGVYSDTDHIVLNPLDDLLNHSVVMGIENKDKNFGNGFYMGKAGAEFLKLWHAAYRTFDDGRWGEHSCIVPFKLHKNHSEVALHVVDSFFRPNGMSIPSKFYTGHYNWTELYGVHLYQRVYKQYFQGKIETRNTSLGEITRHVLFGDSGACFGEKKDVKLTPLRESVK